ncbi:tyrosine-type recombinase/integrase [Streptomyces sp. NPDC048057]|uniref:tyrosine-type recombinase/integrase n=1 Tax=Streptomyces sp. NPDC048057 TaxID=3155628 RepID=UPI0033E43331
MTARGNIVPLHAEGTGAQMAPAVREEWAGWLAERIDPAWRPGEWDGGTRLFTGDVEHRGTVVYRCQTAACEGLCRARGLCATCEKAWRVSDLPAKEFRALYVPDRNRVIDGERTRCRVGECPRETTLWGLCNAHSSLWREAMDRSQESSLEEWIARQEPYSPAPACLVPACRYDARAPRGLCSVHTKRWKHHLEAHPGTPDTVPPQWAESQAPFLNIHQFSLAPLHPVARAEVLYALQQRDARGQKIDPVAVRQAVAHLGEEVETFTADGAGRLPRPSQSNVDSLIRETRRVVTAAFDRFKGMDPADRLVLDLSELGVRGTHGKPTHRPIALDVSEIRQPWLRQLMVSWITEMKPTTSEVNRGNRACSAAGRALDMRPGGGMDPAALTFADMNAVVETFRHLPKLDGEPMSSTHRSGLLSSFFKVLDYGRAAGHLDGMSASFARHSTHTIKRDVPDDEDAGKAIPESVVEQLNEHTDLLGDGITHGRMTVEQIKAMAVAVYELLRDTGRRPYEIAELKLDCLKNKGGDWFLIWDNRKARRNRRHLPVDSDVVGTVHAWLKVRETIDLPTGSEPYLFPPAGENGAARHMVSDQVWNIIRTWADGIPVLLAEEFGPDGERLPFDRSLIFPYAFRHSYCQRRADAGILPPVLRVLMDHRSEATTQVYYRVTEKRKREAVNVMRLYSMDRKGKRTPMASATTYQARSVAVPFGNCTEPSNVKAGGKACPIRFQCAACPSYRPDPSYLPAIDDHVLSLKADKETAVMMDADPFVVRNLDDQIAAFKGVATTMREQIEDMDEDERYEVEEAAKVLRKVRAGAGGRTVALPMPSFPAPRGGATA